MKESPVSKHPEGVVGRTASIRDRGIMLRIREKPEIVLIPLTFGKAQYGCSAYQRS